MSVYADLLEPAETQRRTLFPELPDLLCRASVTVPARNEEFDLPATLDALRNQHAVDGSRLPQASYEVLLLLNNCTDRSAEVALHYAHAHPTFRLRIAECTLPREQAHVGTARRMLMDAACERLEEVDRAQTEVAHPGPHVTRAILTTDADSRVAPDWIAQNLRALEAGADAVGGVIHLHEAELDALDPRVRACYQRDRTLQHLVAQLEALLDPDPADPWPRHLEHFGASLACTCAIYRRCGGLPAVKPLEDVAFVDRLRRIGARLRHSPDVHVWTSARMDGRAEVGLSGQLRHWRRECDLDIPHTVDSAEWMLHRFRALGALRAAYAAGSVGNLPEPWRHAAASLCAQELSVSDFLDRLDCHRLIADEFCGERRDRIEQVIERVKAAIRALVQEHARTLPSGPAVEEHGQTLRPEFEIRG